MYLFSDFSFGSYAGAFDFFILHFPSLYQIHFCICCNFFPKQIMHQPMVLSEFKY